MYDFGWGKAGGTAVSADWQDLWLAGGATAPVPPLSFPLHRALSGRARRLVAVSYGVKRRGRGLRLRVLKFT